MFAIIFTGILNITSPTWILWVHLSIVLWNWGKERNMYSKSTHCHRVLLSSFTFTTWCILNILKELLASVVLGLCLTPSWALQKTIVPPNQVKHTVKTSYEPTIHTPLFDSETCQYLKGSMQVLNLLPQHCKVFPKKKRKNTNFHNVKFCQVHNFFVINVTLISHRVGAMWAGRSPVSWNSS